jgi:benzoyl-CoA reductase/2-hydroxyglutaryl-CoA dehydratase subunit BcrC/BadD/HgdB
MQGLAMEKMKKKSTEKKYATELSQQEIENTRKSIRSSSLKLISENIEKMKKTKDRPSQMQYFDENANFFGKREEEVQQYKEAGGKIIGHFCAFTPIELIYAADAQPIRLDSGFYDTVHLGEEILPVEVCPLVKSSLGVKTVNLHPYFELCDAVINPLTCDGKTKLGEILNDYMPIWTLNVPRVKDSSQSKSFWMEEIKELKKKIEELTGEKISRERLKSAIELVLRAQKAFRRLYDLRKSDVITITGRDAMLVTENLFHDDIHRWTEKTEELCSELERRVAEERSICDPDAPRLMLVGSPIVWPNWKIPNLVEESGGIIVCDEFCSSMRSLYDPVGVDEWTMDDMLRAITERYLLPCTCPCFTPNDDRVVRLLQMAEEFKVDGVIYHVLRGCHVYSIEFLKVKRAFEHKDIPSHKIESEYSQEDMGQIKTRIQAFLEMVKTRK